MKYYSYPKFVFRYPQFIRFVFVINWLTQLRKWYVYPAIKKELAKLKPGSTVIDFGCGEGQFLFPFAKKFPQIQFIALDKNAETIVFLESYIKRLGLKNVQPQLGTITSFTINKPIDLGWCIGVMHYIIEDEIAVKKMAVCNMLLLYQPVNAKQETQFYRWVKNTYDNYDKQSGMQRIYNTEQLCKLFLSSFDIITRRDYYGKNGRWSHGVFDGLQNLILHAPILIKLLAIIILPITYPLVLTGMILDLRDTIHDGNGLLLHLKSKRLDR